MNIKESASNRLTPFLFFCLLLTHYASHLFLKRHDHQFVLVQFSIDSVQLVLALGSEGHGYGQVFLAAAQPGVLRERFRSQMFAENGNNRCSKSFRVQAHDLDRKRTRELDNGIAEIGRASCRERV